MGVTGRQSWEPCRRCARPPPPATHKPGTHTRCRESMQRHTLKPGASTHTDTTNTQHKPHKQGSSARAAPACTRTRQHTVSDGNSRSRSCNNGWNCKQPPPSPTPTHSGAGLVKRWEQRHRSNTTMPVDCPTLSHHHSVTQSLSLISMTSSASGLTAPAVPPASPLPLRPRPCCCLLPPAPRSAAAAPASAAAAAAAPPRLAAPPEVSADPPAAGVPAAPEVGRLLLRISCARWLPSSTDFSASSGVRFLRFGCLLLLVGRPRPLLLRCWRPAAAACSSSSSLLLLLLEAVTGLRLFTA